jgi:hypothetical protein
VRAFCKAMDTSFPSFIAEFENRLRRKRKR